MFKPYNLQIVQENSVFAQDQVFNKMTDRHEKLKAKPQSEETVGVGRKFSGLFREKFLTGGVPPKHQTEGVCLSPGKEGICT